jgi:hypothetical protein
MSDAVLSSALPVSASHSSTTRVLLVAGAGALFLSAAVLIWLVWPRTIALKPTRVLEPVWTMHGLAVTASGREIVATVGDFDNEFTAWLFYDLLRSRTFRSHEVLLTSIPNVGGNATRIMVCVGPDLLAGVGKIADWHSNRRTDSIAWAAVADEVVNRWRQQTRMFQAAYAMPARKKLEEIPRRTLREYMQRFIRFKSLTDPRTERATAAVPALSPSEAQQLAGDMITIAEFYELPLDLLLGIGAMENNYMNVRGDLENTAWKRRAQPGDIVLRRARGRVLVLNDSAGVWQITRETLRYAHRLYTRDQRDYPRLPEHLRPPAELDLLDVQPAVLTTYAGLLLRDLIDRFGGDTAKATGAYNGGPGNPNMHYEEGVGRVATYARTLVERAASLHGQSIADMKLLTHPR